MTYDKKCRIESALLRNRRITIGYLSRPPHIPLPELWIIYMWYLLFIFFTYSRTKHSYLSRRDETDFSSVHIYCFVIFCTRHKLYTNTLCVHILLEEGRMCNIHEIKTLCDVNEMDDFFLVFVLICFWYSHFDITILCGIFYKYLYTNYKL